MHTSAYALDNQHTAAPAHHRALADLLDAHTQARISGLPEWPGITRCLEVGAGGGSMSERLAQLVGPLGGRVTAVDRQADHLVPGPHLEVVAYDLTEGRLAEVVGDRFDLVLARMVLQHLPARRRILTELSQLLAPGGVLLVEGWVPAAPDGPEVVLRAPDPPAAELYERCRRAVGRQFVASGADPTWQRQLHGHLLDDGLVGVDTVIRGEYWTGGSPGLRLAVTAAAQLAPRLAGAGITEADIGRLAELVDQPGWLVHGQLLYSTAGRAGGAGAAS